MYISQLELVAFGSFTNAVFDFSSPQPGFHLVYGANEAGKSTLRRALIHWLFGIPERTADIYLHATDRLRIGGLLGNSQAQTLQCYRRKGRKNTLLDVHQQPLEESCLQPFLGNLNSAQFAALFCFDHERLRQGGEDLFTSGGHLGESLFEAGTGSLRIHDLLAELDKESQDLFKPRASKPKLNQSLRIYKEACQRVKMYSLSAYEWHRQADALEEAQNHYASLLSQLQTLRAEQHRLLRIQRTLPLLQRYQTLHAAVTVLGDVLLLPDDAALKRLEVNNHLNVALAQKTHSQQIITELQNQLAEIKLPEALLVQKTTLDTLRERLGWHQKAARDLPGVRTEWRSVEQEALTLLHRIYPDRDLAHPPTLTDPQRERLKHLANEYPILREKQGLIAKQFDTLTQQLARYQGHLENLAVIPDLTELRAILTRAIKYSDLAETLPTEAQELKLIATKVDVGLKQLGLWYHSLDALEQVNLPNHETVERFDRRFKEMELDRQRVKEHITLARERHNRASEKVNALRWSGDIPTEEELLQIRQTRHRLWETLKNSRTTELFRTFEETMFKTDEIADRLRREAHRVAEQANLLAEQHSTKLEYEQYVKKWRTSCDLLTELQSEWETVWQASGIKPWPPAEMRAWLSECFNLRQQVTQFRERQQRFATQQQFFTQLNDELRQQVSQFCNPTPLMRLADLIEQGQTYLAEMMTLQRQQDTLKNQRQQAILELKRLTTEQQQVTDTLNTWQIAWAEALAPLELPVTTSTGVARTVLDILDQVINKLDKVQGLRRRVERMEADAHQFYQEVGRLVQKLAPELSQEPVEQAVLILFNRLNQAEKDSARHEQLTQQLQIEQEQYQRATTGVQTAQAHLQTLFTQAHCHDLEALEIVEQKSARKKTLQQQFSEVEQHLLEQGEGMSVAELTEAINGVDRDQLPNQLEQFSLQIKQLEQKRSEWDRAIGEQQTLLKQMDGNASAARAAEDAQLALADIQEQSERYIELHLAATVLRQAIEYYQEKYQKPLLQRASELFARLTLENFWGLKVGYQESDDQPIVLGLRNPDSEGIPTPGMSDGTCDQLYLALRLASVERFLEKGEAIPLVLDDILINFDDERAYATLSVLGELSQRTQILFFTHHSRLEELARRAIPATQLKIHSLQ